MRLRRFKRYREGYATRPDIQADTSWMAFKSMAIIPLDNHGWTYRLDGALAHARDADGMIRAVFENSDPTRFVVACLGYEALHTYRDP